MKLVGHYVYSPIVLLVLIELGVACLAVYLSAAVIASTTGSLSRDWFVPLWPWALGFSAAVSIALTGMGLYQSKQRLRIEGVLARLVVGLGIAAMGVALLHVLFPLDINAADWALSFAFALLLLGATRVMLWKWVEHDVFQRRVLIYGAGERAASVLQLRRRSDRRGFNVVGFVPTPGDKRVIDDERVVKVEGSLLDYARAKRVDEIVIGMDDRRNNFPVEDLLKCKFAGISVVGLVTFLERETGRVTVDIVNPAWLIFADGFRTRSGLALATRTLDFATALALLLMTAPIMIVIALAIMIDNGRPILYRQTRVGYLGKEFTLYKFRSMVTNAEADGVAQWAQTGDSRVTRVGGLLRKLRLDELPQLINVLKGDMSLVGPRPERPEFVERLSEKIPYYQERHAVKPGITGWAQLSYAYGASDRDSLEKLKYDLYYIKHKSLIFDLMVLLQTVEVVLWGKGAR